MTIVYYDNEPTRRRATAGSRSARNASTASDPDVGRQFNFTVTDAARCDLPADVLAGQCSEPIQVAAGVNDDRRGARTAGTDLVDVVAFPWDRLLTVNLINRTATVEVPVSDCAERRDAGPLRQQGAARPAEGLQGPRAGQRRPGRQDVLLQRRHATSNDQLGPFKITAGRPTQCKIVGIFPIGTTVDGDENLGSRTRQVDEPGEFIDTTGEGSHHPAGHQHHHDHQHRDGPARGLQGTDPVVDCARRSTGRGASRSSRRSSSRSTAARSSPSRRASARRPSASRSATTPSPRSTTTTTSSTRTLRARHHRLPGRP